MNKMTQGWTNGLLGVIIFAGSLPATRLAVAELSPIFLTSARAATAALAGALLLAFWRQPVPSRRMFPSLLCICAGVVIGFPLLTAIALQQITSARGMVFLGLLPLCTALFAVLRGGERPSWPFWLFSCAGALCITGYAASGNLSGTWQGSLLMLSAVIVCGLGYAEGAQLSRQLGGWQVISWALLLSLPIALPLAFLTRPVSLSTVSLVTWSSLLYVSFFSMLIGFMFWYRGLALGGIAAVGQLQLLQPFIGLGLAALLLHETVNSLMFITTLAAVICVAGARKYA